MIGDGHGKIQIFNASSSQLSLVRSFKAHWSGIYFIRQSPFNPNYVATSEDKTVKVWNLSSPTNWTLIRAFSQNSSVYAMNWIDADTLALGGPADYIWSLYGPYTIKIWSLSTGQMKRTISVPYYYVYLLELLSNKIHLAVGGGFAIYDINIYNINDGRLVSTLRGHSYYVNDFVQISNSNLLASASGDGTVRIWNLTTNECIFSLLGHRGGALNLKQITPNIIASTDGDSSINLWDVSNVRLIRTLTGRETLSGMYLEVINNGQTLVSSEYKTIKLWNWTNGECLQTLKTDIWISIRALAVVTNG